MKFAILWISFVFSFSLQARDYKLIRSLKSYLEDSNELKRSILKKIYNNNLAYYTCSVNQKEMLRGHQVESYDLMMGWIANMLEYEKKHNIRKYIKKKKRGNATVTTRLSELTKVYSILRCVTRNLSKVKFHCNSDKPKCIVENKTAYTLPIIDSHIHLCKGFWKHPKKAAGVIIHEIAHKCWATDAAYFNHKFKAPKSTFPSHWSEIADTYEYWQTFGFCVPGIDCP